MRGAAARRRARRGACRAGSVTRRRLGYRAPCSGQLLVICPTPNTRGVHWPPVTSCFNSSIHGRGGSPIRDPTYNFTPNHVQPFECACAANCILSFKIFHSIFGLTLALTGGWSMPPPPLSFFLRCTPNYVSDRAEILHSLWHILCATFGKEILSGHLMSGHGAMTSQ